MTVAEADHAALPDDNPHICVRCAAAGNACCRRARVFVTTGDIERIAARVGAGDFVEYVRLDRESWRGGTDGAWERIFDSAGRTRVLKRGETAGGCVFLAPGGCRLAMDVRPLVCRLYPYEYDAGTLKGVTPLLCPPEDQANHPLLLAQLGMNRDAAEIWREMLYREIGDEFGQR